ncbi:hypothetical protein B0H16DRAFT_1577370 [Mycena metata]|uniref:Uncharacterized protein n=1 Tax=Mycena metata TaxID=1033252 RepID=A0AAD7I4F6_9AGAR|nr:hypothetical protein B0H16DRAFT_1633351 [Mycena metata]KAJ7734836.1 hypothetical protein B0H16DRAFT_1577370 [Mycena metata]
MKIPLCFPFPRPPCTHHTRPPSRRPLRFNSPSTLHRLLQGDPPISPVDLQFFVCSALKSFVIHFPTARSDPVRVELVHGSCNVPSAACGLIPAFRLFVSFPSRASSKPCTNTCRGNGVNLPRFIRQPHHLVHRRSLLRGLLTRPLPSPHIRRPVHFLLFLLSIPRPGVHQSTPLLPRCPLVMFTTILRTRLPNASPPLLRNFNLVILLMRWM